MGCCKDISHHYLIHFPIDVARRAMQIEEVNFAHKHWWQFCLKSRTLFRLMGFYPFDFAEPQGK
jgi:hypothetical protein